MGVGTSTFRRSNRVSGPNSSGSERSFPIINFAFLLVGAVLLTVGYTTGIGGNSLIISGFFLIAVAIIGIAFRLVAYKRPVPTQEMRTGQSHSVPIYSVSSNLQQQQPTHPTVDFPTPIVDEPPPYVTVTALAPPSYYDVTKEGSDYHMQIEPPEDKPN